MVNDNTRRAPYRPAVRAELERGREVGYDYLQNALDALADGTIGLIETAPALLEDDTSDIRERLDRGEAEAFVAARATGGPLVTDDGAARALAAGSDIPLTGSIGLLIRGVVRGELSVETADDWLATWIDERNYYAPVESVTAVLPDEFD